MNEVYVKYGDEAEKIAFSILEKMNVKEQLYQLDKKNPLIGIKPNLAVAQPSEWGATTSPELVKGVVKYLKNLGFDNQIILESSWIGDNTEKAFEICGYKKISREFDIHLIDLKKDQCREFNINGINFNICKRALEVDYLINMPVLKAHCQTRVTCALKNLKGCIPDRDKKLFHTLGLHRPIALLNSILKVDLVLVDGLIGDLTHEEGGNPVKMNRVIAGTDPVLVDTYAAGLLGYTASDIEYIILSEKMGVGSTNLIKDNIIELNKSKDIVEINKVIAGEEIDYLKKWVVDDQACSACYGSLIHALMRLKERNSLKRLSNKIYIGQAYKKKGHPEIGIGLCTDKFKYNVPGCPPDAKSILEFLESRFGSN